MTRQLFLFIGLLAAQILSAQSYCGTEITADVRQWLNAQTAARFSQPVPQTTLYTPVHIHILGDDNGNGYFPKASAYSLICELNYHYAPLNMVFFLSDSITYIDSTPYYNQANLAYGSQMMGLYNVPDVCNIYVVNYLAGVCGYAFFPNSGPDQGRGGIILKKSCAQPGSTTLEHEMGHYFGLPHTFDQWNTANAEFVDGSNCATKGDLFCDTPADFLDYRWNCPYTGTQLDPQGQPYAPDGSLFMSYSNEPCPNRFSPLQQSAIIYSRTNDRPYLNSTPVPSFIAPSPVTLLSPANNAVNVPSNSNAFFSWNASPGASDYNLLIKKASTSSFMNAQFSIFTSDTFAFVNNLLPDSVYEWKVIPVNGGSTCIYPDSSASAVNAFTVVFVDAITTFSADHSFLLVYPVPLQDDEEFYRFRLAESSIVTIVLTDMSGRVVYSEEREANAGIVEGTIHLGELKEGAYFFSVQTSSFRAARRVIKLNK